MKAPSPKGVVRGHWVEVKTVKGKGGPKIAAAHNLRDAKYERGMPTNIDPNRTALNRVLIGPARSEAVAQLVRNTLLDVGITKPRKNSPLLIEFVFTLPPKLASNTAYWDHCIAWLAQRYVGCPIVSATVHMDESVPHCHALLIPLLRKENGTVTLGATYWLGKKKDIHDMRDDFKAKVTAPFGLTGPTSKFVDLKRGEIALPKEKRGVQTDSLPCVGIEKQHITISAVINTCSGSWLPSVLGSKRTKMVCGMGRLSYF